MSGPASTFRERAAQALGDAGLQKALANVPAGFIEKRAKARGALPEFDRLRDEAAAMKRHTLDNLAFYLSAFIERAGAAGAKTHLAEGPEEACRIVSGILAARGARLVTKGKSMISEEIGLNAALEKAGVRVVETDLGEYIIQLRGERPSHIVAPAIHLSRRQIEADFRRAHAGLPEERVLATDADLVAEARAVLRGQFCAADAGITGANMLIAETGSAVLVTNEGNGDLTATLPKTHIVIASIEKIVPTLEDASLVLRLLARSATGQEISAYTSFFTGPRRRGDADGPEEMHIVLLDNNRSNILAGPFSDILKCIRCGACLNHCPVFQAVGGHAYGGVYPGPMGEVLSPALPGAGGAPGMTEACTLCGRCEEVCPMRIPLPSLIRRRRAEAFARGEGGAGMRAGLKGWGWLARRPRLHAAVMAAAARAGRLLAAGRGAIRALPGLSGWFAARDLPAPEGRTFSALWRKTKGRPG